MTQPRATKLLARYDVAKPGLRVLDYGCGDGAARRHFEALGFDYQGWDIGDAAQPEPAPFVNLSYVLNVVAELGERRDVARRAWSLAGDAMIVAVPPGFRADLAGRYCKVPAGELEDRLRSRTGWDKVNLAWLGAALETDNVFALGPDVYLVSREAFDPAGRNGPAAAPHRRDVLAWVPKIAAALGLAGLASPAFAQSVRDRVTDILVEKFNVEGSEITPGAYLKSDLGIDSLDIVELMLALEQEFNITIPGEVSEQMLTVGQIIGYVSSHTGG